MSLIERIVPLIHDVLASNTIPVTVLGTEERDGAEYVFLKAHDKITYAKSKQLQVHGAKAHGSIDTFWKRWSLGKCHSLNESAAQLIQDCRIVRVELSSEVNPLPTQTVQVFKAIKETVFVYPTEAYTKGMVVDEAWIDRLCRQQHVLVRVDDKYLDLAAAQYGCVDDDLKTGFPCILRPWDKIPFLAGASILEVMTPSEALTGMDPKENQTNIIKSTVLTVYNALNKTPLKK